jgi:hypothetical protein
VFFEFLNNPGLFIGIHNHSCILLD